MVKSETRRDAEIVVRNPSQRLLGKKFRDSKKIKTNHAKTRLRDLSKTLPRFRDTAKIFRDPRFSRYHSLPLILEAPQFHFWTRVEKFARGFTAAFPGNVRQTTYVKKRFRFNTVHILYSCRAIFFLKKDIMCQ